MRAHNCAALVPPRAPLGSIALSATAPPSCVSWRREMRPEAAALASSSNAVAPSSSELVA
jgi:hypothetical protein